MGSNCPYCDEYQDALKATERFEWPLPLTKLCGTDADQVLTLLKDYLEAFARRKDADDEYDKACIPSGSIYTNDLQMRWLYLGKCRKEARDAQWFQDLAFRDLMIAMLGEETVDREQLAYVDNDYDLNDE